MQILRIICDWLICVFNRITGPPILFNYHGHYSDVKMDAMASQITSLTMVHSTVYLGADQRQHQSSASLTFVRGIHRWPVNSSHKGPVTWKCFHLMTSSWMQWLVNAFCVRDKWPMDSFTNEANGFYVHHVMMSSWDKWIPCPPCHDVIVG